MDKKKGDVFFAQQIVNHISAIQKYVADKTYEQFIDDEELIDAVMFRFIQLIENIKNISDDFKSEHDQIPWGEIIGFRNGIVHEYGKADYTIVYETATQDLEELKEAFCSLS